MNYLSDRIQTAMNQILALWATPRSTSTAFEWMMRQRGDYSCWHEPFGEAWYQGEDLRWPRATPESKRTPGLTFASVWEGLRGDARKHPVFIKDFPHYTKHMWSADFLGSFTHSFLIRDPAKVVTSMYKHWPDFCLEETGMVELRELFDLLANGTGEVPPVIDSDDLLENPHDIAQAWCDALCIPFFESALSWEAGDREEVSWYEHANLRNSTGLMNQPRHYIDITDAPEKVREIYEIALPHYQAVYAHRLRVPGN
jgi:adenylylsulfate kinase